MTNIETVPSKRGPVSMKRSFPTKDSFSTKKRKCNELTYVLQPQNQETVSVKRGPVPMKKDWHKSVESCETWQYREPTYCSYVMAMMTPRGRAWQKRPVYMMKRDLPNKGSLSKNNWYCKEPTNWLRNDHDRRTLRDCSRQKRLCCVYEKRFEQESYARVGLFYATGLIM